MEEKLEPRLEFISVGSEYFAGVGVITCPINSKESFGKILAKTTHECYAEPAPVTTSPIVLPITPPTPVSVRPLGPS